ncbi:MAG: hypothetical protein ACQER0_05190 [Bacillota bacterium]
MRRKVKYLLVMLLFFSLIFSQPIFADQIELKNGNSLRGEVQNNTLQLKTSYAQLNIQSRYLTKIKNENGVFRVKAAANNRFSGQLMTDINFASGASNKKIAAAEIASINFSSTDAFSNNKELKLSLKNGDFFFANPVEKSISLNTSLGSSVNLNYNNIKSIEYLAGEDLYLINRVKGAAVKSNLKNKKIIVWPAAAEIIEIDFNQLQQITFK